VRTIIQKKTTNKSQRNRSEPWWTHELTVMWKTTNHLRRNYQRTRDNAEQRETNNAADFEQKAKYAATIKRGKIVERILQPNNRSQPLERGI